MTEKLKPTPGPWIFGDWLNNKPGEVDAAGWVDVWARLPDGERSLPVVSCKHQQEIENARLIAEAGTVHSECGLSPRELLEGYMELRKALDELYDECGGYMPDTRKSVWRDASAALAKHKEL